MGVEFGCQNQSGRWLDVLHSYGQYVVPLPQLDVSRADVERLPVPFSLPIHCRSGVAPVLTISGPAQMRALGCVCLMNWKTFFQLTFPPTGELNPSNSNSTAVE